MNADSITYHHEAVDEYFHMCVWRGGETIAKLCTLVRVYRYNNLHWVKARTQLPTLWWAPWGRTVGVLLYTGCGGCGGCGGAVRLMEISPPGSSCISIDEVYARAAVYELFMSILIHLLSTPSCWFSKTHFLERLSSKTIPLRWVSMLYCFAFFKMNISRVS